MINIAGVILQYLILFFLYLFIYKLAKNIYRDLKSAKKVVVNNTEQLFLKVIVAECLVKNNLDEVVRVDTSLNIGRAENNDIIIASPIVSAEHAIISCVKGKYVITDLDSTNGTLLNDKKVSGSAVVKPGDEISIGPARFIAQGE